MASTESPRLFHAPSSYYSMVARLALAEAGIAYRPVFVDIHARMTQQSPDYVRMNPGMTVQTLALPDRALGESRAIAEFAFGLAGPPPDAETRSWLDLHYSFPIEELTIGGLLARHPLARVLVPRKLARSRDRLLAMAEACPDLADAYRARAAVFAERVRTFDPQDAARLAAARRDEAIGLLGQLEAHLGIGGEVLVPPDHGIADVVWTVFLARIAFVGMAAEIARRPRLARYWHAMQARPAFAQADIWTRLHVMRLVGGMLGIVGSRA